MRKINEGISQLAVARGACSPAKAEETNPLYNAKAKSSYGMVMFYLT